MKSIQQKHVTDHRATYRYKPQRAILIIAFQKISQLIFRKFWKGSVSSNCIYIIPYFSQFVNCLFFDYCGTGFKSRIHPQYHCKGMAICSPKQLMGIIIPSLRLCPQVPVNLLRKNRLQGSESGVQTPVLEIQITSEGKHTTPALISSKTGFRPLQMPLTRCWLPCYTLAYWSMKRDHR